MTVALSSVDDTEARSSVDEMEAQSSVELAVARAWSVGELERTDQWDLPFG